MNIDHYTLTPDQLTKALALDRVSLGLAIGSPIVIVLTLLIALRLGYFVWLRDRVARVSTRPALQALLFLPCFLSLVTLAQLPLDAWGHHIAVAYGLSVQTWPGWIGDQALGLALAILLVAPVGAIALWLLRHRSRRAWLWAWLAGVPLLLLINFASPYVIDPLFNHFDPLAASQPKLTEQLQQLAAKAGETIPQERIFVMRASEKSTTINAYVTGFGASKRVVVWDTTLARCPSDEILFILGHELGHYALGHIPRLIGFACLGLLLALWLAQRVMTWLIPRLRVDGLADLAAVPHWTLVFLVLALLGGPLQALFSRDQEHAADVYGQELVHRVVADPAQTAARAFQRLGELSLDVPDPDPLRVFLLESHPSISDRVRFAVRYDPWRPAQAARYFPLE